MATSHRISNRSRTPVSFVPRSRFRHRIRSVTVCAVTCIFVTTTTMFHITSTCHAGDIDFNRDVRPILSNNCFLCHGPDLEGLEAGLRLDLSEGATQPVESGLTAVIPGKPDESELLARVTSEDEDLRMPPADHGAPLTAAQIDTLRRWIEQGAPYAMHWSYVKPARPDLPSVAGGHQTWPRNAIDHFVLSRMLEHQLTPGSPADRYAIARRVFLDLTGLPPTISEVDAFVNDTAPDAYEKLVDNLLARPTFGEHWARKWLDLARYADSAGYADDPPRTIWAYRDWVIRAINDNMPFDQFTLEQLAGDLLPDPSEQQLVATAFHRNTLTNNEGGTQDEEFRNVAVVDRVNTTMAVWMGTTMACAQCHTHKYDPITQEEYFKFFAIFNNTQDNDRRDESPTIPLFTADQKQQRSDLGAEIASLKAKISQPTAELKASQKAWEVELRIEPTWQPLAASSAKRSSGQKIHVLENGGLFVETESLEALPAKDDYVVKLPVDANTNIGALRLSALPHKTLPNNGSGHSGGNFVITHLKAQLVPHNASSPVARFVRITNNGRKQILSLAEVQVFSGGENIAVRGKATQHSTAYAGPPQYAIDGNTDGDYQKKSTTHTATVDDPWWELDLEVAAQIEKVVVWNRTDGGVGSRLANFTVELLSEDRTTIWSTTQKKPPAPSTDFSPSNVRDISFSTAVTDYHQPGFNPKDVLTGKTGRQNGWAVGGAQGKPHHLVLVPTKPVRPVSDSTLRVTIRHQSPHSRHLLGHFSFSTTTEATAIRRSAVPAQHLATIDTAAEERTAQNASALAAWYRANAAPELKDARSRLKKLEKQLAELKPATTVPVLRERMGQRRETHLQFRGNYLDKGPQVTVGTPAIFHASPEQLDRRTLSQWLTSADNPLTARVLANRYWEAIFGRGLVVTSEEFGSQGEQPTHPQLLDWLATELIQNNWDTKHFLRLLVTSATYRQSVRISGNQNTGDPDNRWLSRGPRVRHTAEMVRDQALFAAGLLSPKMYGPPVKPPQPDMGLKAAFGGKTDWDPSTGEDRYRRGIYTNWRRSNPYPSMATFDAPNREVCTVRRNSTNTPLQSLVTLNDPVYVEAAQALARRVMADESSLSNQVTLAFRRCLLRAPSPQELKFLCALYDETSETLRNQSAEAMALATDPLGPLPDSIDPVSAAAMTVVCNIILNLDEMFLKR